MLEYTHLSELERQAVIRVPKHPQLRCDFYGINLGNTSEQVRPNQGLFCLRMPPANETQIFLRNNGPCIRCRKFLQKIVHLAQEENNDIQGFFCHDRDRRGFYIHSIHSDKSREYLGDNYQFLLELLSKCDNIHDKSSEWHEPCLECSSDQEQ